MLERTKLLQMRASAAVISSCMHIRPVSCTCSHEKVRPGDTLWFTIELSETNGTSGMIGKSSPPSDSCHTLIRTRPNSTHFWHYPSTSVAVTWIQMSKQYALRFELYG